METTGWKKTDTARAKGIWTEYQNHHDLSGRIGQVAGIDPASKKVWIANSIPEIIRQRDSEGKKCLLLFERIGAKTYYHKGTRR